MLTFTFFRSPYSDATIYSSFTMRLYTLFGLAITATALPSQTRRSDDFEVQPWKAAGAGDSRGPCPMMNTLANHGYLYVISRLLAHGTNEVHLDM